MPSQASNPIRASAAEPPGSGSAEHKLPGDEVAPGTPQTGENTCPRCAGSGQVEGGACPDCEGSGTVVVNVGDA
jgi:DnaJ-class molecular chaperone